MSIGHSGCRFLLNTLCIFYGHIHGQVSEKINIGSCEVLCVFLARVFTRCVLLARVSTRCVFHARVFTDCVFHARVFTDCVFPTHLPVNKGNEKKCHRPNYCFTYERCEYQTDEPTKNKKLQHAPPFFALNQPILKVSAFSNLRYSHPRYTPFCLGRCRRFRPSTRES